MSGSISPISNQSADYAVQNQGGQNAEVQALEQAVQQLLNALQSGGGQSQGGLGEGDLSQDGGSGLTGGATMPPSQSYTPASSQGGTDPSMGQGPSYNSDPYAGSGGQSMPASSDLSLTPQSDAGSTGGANSEIQSLEQAVQELLAALQQQDGGQTQAPQGQGSTGGVPSGTGGTGGTGTAGAAGGTGTPGGAGATGGQSTLAQDYNNVLAQVSANGNSAQNVQQAVQQFLQDANASGSDSDSNLQTAMNNILGSLQNGTYSQQGSQGALEGAATRDGLSGVNTVSIAGKAGGDAQASGAFDAASNDKGSLGANTAILESEIANGNSSGSQQITNNATALATEATNAANDANAKGDTASAQQDTALANAATNIANSANGTGDGSYSGSASLAALQQALPDDSNKDAAQTTAAA